MCYHDHDQSLEIQTAQRTNQIAGFNCALAALQAATIFGRHDKWRVENIFDDQTSDESRVMATILQLKVSKRRLFEKVSLEHCLRRKCD